MKWKVKTPDAEFTAESLDELKQWYREDRLRPEHYVYHPVLERWMYAKELEELRSTISQSEQTSIAGAKRSIPEVQARSGITDGVKMGCGMSIVLPILIILGLIIVLFFIFSGVGKHFLGGA